MKKKFLVIHPFLFALFPIAFLYNRGITYVSFSDILVPVAVVLLFALLVLGIFYLLYRDLKKAGVLTSVFMIMFFSYGHIHDLLCPYIKLVMVRNAILMGVWCAVLVAAACFLLKTKRTLVNLTKLFNATAVVLIIIPLSGIVFNIPELFRTVNIEKGNIEGLKIEKTAKKSNSNEQFPDIYYLIFDRYNDQVSLKRFFNFDNSEFLKYLTDKGFYVAAQSTSNYPCTTHSLASSLNMQYLNTMFAKMGESPENTRAMAAIIENSIVAKFLKAKGYKYLLSGSWFQLTRCSKLADVDYNLSLLPEFSMVLYRTTMLYPVTAKLGVLDKRTEHWKRVLYKFAKLPEAANVQGPVFVFAHFLIPHDPYVFNVDGTFLERSVEEQRTRERKYVDQVKFANKKIKELVDKILSKSKTPPIIIIQADEGSYPDKWKPNTDLAKLTNNEFEQKMGILNAVYLPQANKSLLYPSMTPVNTFRIIFNSYFGAQLKMLPDKNYIFYDKHWWRVLEKNSQGPRKCVN